MTTFSKKINTRKLQLESLENRELLSVNPLLPNDDTTPVATAAPEVQAAVSGGKREDITFNNGVYDVNGHSIIATHNTTGVADYVFTTTGGKVKIRLQRSEKDNDILEESNSGIGLWKVQSGHTYNDGSPLNNKTDKGLTDNLTMEFEYELDAGTYVIRLHFRSHGEWEWHGGGSLLWGWNNDYEREHYYKLRVEHVQKLPAPSLSVGTVTSNSVPLSWNSVSNGYSYSVEYKTTSASYWSSWTTTTGTSTSTTVSGLYANTEYQFRIKAKANGSGNYTDSDYYTVSTKTADAIGDTIATAYNVSFSNNAFNSGTQYVGDGTYGNRDVDMYKITVAAGDTYTFRTAAVSGQSTVDTVIRLFNASGTQLQIADGDESGVTYDVLTWEATAAGTYYIGVSSWYNRSYSPSTAGSGTSANTGYYTLSITRTAPKLSTPTLSVGTPTSNSVPLSWNSVSNGYSYSVEYKTTSASYWSSWTTTTGTSTTVSGLYANTEYQFRIKANSSGSYTESDYYTVSTKTADAIGDTIATAYNVSFSNNAFTSGTQYVGDGTYGNKDVDMYKFTVASGDVGKTFTFQTAAVSGQSTVDTYIRLFNSSGTQLDAKDTGIYDVLAWTATAEGTYYLGISNYNNSSYSPSIAGSGTSGGTGYYSLSITRTTPPDAIGDTIATAYNVSFSNNAFNSGTQRIGDGIYDTKDVDMYKITVAAGDVGRTYTFLTAAVSGQSTVDTYIRLFNASGTPLDGISYNDDYAGGGLYSRLTWTFSAAGDYYLGVSSYGNSFGNGTYNPLTAGSGPGGSTGYYTLSISRTVPLLDVPANFRTGTVASNSVQLLWNTVSNATGYTIQRSTTNSTNDSYWTTIATISSGSTNSHTDVASSNTTYYYRILAKGNGSTYGDSPWSNPFVSVTTPKEILSTPVLSVGTVASNSVALSWNSVNYASSYTLQYKTTSGSWTSSTLTGTNTTVTGLSAGTYYQFQLKANGTGNYQDSPYPTNPVYATTAPVLSAGTVTANSITLSWTGSANSYTLQYKTTNGSWTTWSPNPTGNSATVTGLSANESYQFHVMANASGSYPASPYSNTVDVSKPQLATPVLSVGTVASNSVALSWGSVTNASSYTLQYKLALSSSWTTWSSSLTGTNTNVTGLSANRDYQFQVKANGNGTTNTDSNYSTTAPATTLKITLFTPTLSTGTITSDSVALSWNSVSNASSYSLHFKGPSDSYWWVWSSTLTGTNTTVTGLSANTEYQFRVKANGTGDYQDSLYPATPAAATTEKITLTPPVLSAVTVTSNSVALSWTSVNYATSYTLRSKTASGSWTTYATLTGTSIAVAGLSAGTTYQFQVQATVPADYQVSPSNIVDVTPLIDDAIGDTIATAYNVSFTNNTFISGTQKIGGGIYGNKDVDMYKFTVASGDVGKTFTFRTFAVSGQSTVDTFIRLFNASGTQLTVADGDESGYFYDLLTWTPTAAGDYYLGVSGYSNTSYNPFTAGSGTSGSTGYYSLSIARTTQLTAPVLSVGTVTSNSIAVSWTSVSNASSYTVQCKPALASESAWSTLSSTWTTINLTLSGGFSHQFRVKANGNGTTYTDSPWSNTVSPTIPSPPLATPTLSTGTVTSNSVALSWTSVSNASSYTVQYKTELGSWTSSTLTGTSTTVTGLSAGTTYQFKVKANGNGTTYTDSNDSNTVPATTLTNDDAYEPNNTFATAYNLGTLTSQRVINNLVVLNDDWFKFTINAAGNSNSSVRIDFTHSLGDLDLRLYDSSQTCLSSSCGTGNFEQISLNGLAAGTYYVWIYGYGGATNPSYTLTINPPASGIQLTAPTWNTLTGGVTSASGSWTAVPNRSSYTVEWSTSYHFTTITGSWTGTAASFSQSNIPAGNYYFRVKAVGNGTTSSDSPWEVYGSPTAVAVTAATGNDDAYEPNDSFKTAADLGTLTQRTVISSLVANNDDWYKFTTNYTGTATNNIILSAAGATANQGDLDLYLYNASGKIIAVSQSTSNNELISLNGLAAGTYYIWVQPVNGIPNPNYTLTINAPLPPAPATPQNFNGTPTVNSVELTWSAVSANTTGYEIWYKKIEDAQYTTVTVSGASTTTRTISGLSANTTYQFQLRAVGPGGNSAWVSITRSTPPVVTPPAAPTGLTVNGTPTQTSIGLKWNAQSGVTGFTLEYKTALASSHWSTYSSTIAASATSIDVTGLTAGTEYQFRLYAKNAVGTSPESAVYTNRTAAASTAGQNYAVLFVGGVNWSSNFNQAYDALVDIYDVLQDGYGLSQQNIYVLYADGTDTGIDRPGSSGRGVNSDMSFALSNRVYSATYVNLDNVFTELGSKMGANDHLLFYTEDHGSGSSSSTTYGEETLCTWSGAFITDTQLATSMQKIQAGYITTYFAQCFSGGMLDNILDPATGQKRAGFSPNVHIYGMAAESHYDTSRIGPYDAVQAFIDAMNPSYRTASNNPTGNTIINFVKANNQFKAPYSYANNTSGPYGADDYDHPWGIGDSFTLFTQGAGRMYNAKSFTSGGDLLITNSATSNTAALELLAGNNVYINYAYSNPQNAAVSATVTVYGREPQTYTINDDGTGSLAENFDLGVFETGTYSVIVELFVGEEYLTFTNNFTVLAQSADIADTLAAAKDITFENYTFTTTSFIGDGLYGGKDADIYSFVLDIFDIGKTLVFDSFGGTLLPVNTYLRLFDADGNELAHSVLKGQNVVSTLYYTITTAGLYYLGVSALENTSYSPTKTEDGVAGTTGSYQLNGRISETKADLTLNYDFSWVDNILWTNSATGANRVVPKSNEDLYVNYKFANIGYTAAGSVTNRITITGANGYLESHDFISSSIAAGDFQSLASNYNWGKLAAGDYTITVELDVNNVLTNAFSALNELNEEHHSASWSFTVASADSVTVGKKDGTAPTSSVTATFAVDHFNRIEAKNSKGKVTTTATSYVIKVYAWDAKKGTFSTKAAKTFTVKSTAANTADGILTYTLTGLKANTLYQITVQAKADAKTVYVDGIKTEGNTAGEVRTLGEIRTWATVPNASLKVSTTTENSVNVKVSNWGTSGGLWTQAVAKSANVYTPIETDKATAKVTKAISAVDTLLVTYKKNGVTQKVTLTWDGESWSSSDGVSFDTAKGIITIENLPPSVKYTVQVRFNRGSEAVAVKATSVSVSTTARKFSAPVISNFQLTADNTAQVSFNLSQDVNGREATQYKVELMNIAADGKKTVAKTITVDINNTNDAWSFDGDSVTAYITGLTVGMEYQVRVKALAAKKTSTYNYTNIASDSALSGTMTA